MNNIEKLKKIKELSKPLIDFIEQELNPDEKIEISHQGFKLISEEAYLPKDDLNMSEINDLTSKVYDLIDEIDKLEKTTYVIDFSIISQNLTRDEMIQSIKYALTGYEGFYLCPDRYGLNENEECHSDYDCKKCWLNAIKEVKFKGEE